jgi:GNAT superfamily N-acetyltransferase
VADPVVRDAEPDDVAAVCAFGEAHVRPHYTPLIGAAAADAQVRHWWNESAIGSAVSAGLVVVAEVDGRVVGVGQRGRSGADHVVYKLYVSPERRGSGLGRRLLDALIGQLPPDADRLAIEHFAANERAGAFYEREGFSVERIEPSPTGDPGLGVVWRARALS